MDKLKKIILRENRTLFDTLPLTYLFAYIVLYGGALLSLFLLARKIPYIFTSDPEVADFMYTYTAFIGIWVFFIAVALIFKNNRPMIGQLFPKKISKVIIGLVIGGVVGFVLNSINVVSAILLGDLKLSFYKVEVLPIIGFIIFICVQSGGEEIINRLYIYQKLRRRYKNPFVAVIGNALFFLSLHLSNPGVNVACLVELFLWGVLFALMVLYFDNLWISIACHTAWNFTQNIFYGLPNSGIVSKFSIFKIDSAVDDFFYDTGFGVEGSWGAVLILAIVCVVLIAIFKGKEKNDLWADWKPNKAKPVNTVNAQ